MSSVPPLLPAHAAWLDHHGVVPFLEHSPMTAAGLLLTIIRYKCVIVMVGASCGLIATLCGVWVNRSDPDGWAISIFGIVPALLALGAWLIFLLAGWLRTRWQAPPARLLELSRYGVRVSTQTEPATENGPRLDPQGRHLLPWTSWHDVLTCDVAGPTFTLALRTPPGRLDLALTSAGARDAIALAAALWAEARYPRI